ncbi:FtsW/RodA/SpoVE family cell cycle protein [Thermosipho ferrireducens]|uniref:Probable peptidoglycan glycosyltransferase FtsW n=1 Tax=Thermosipho ferrireducens TaxID=2571116 RepID=A0ABX7S9N5_9BACT|nr:FtsW/RodA/SpoVE family cell cycle protein [Thermosipho ferrireducens]QTA38575.1 FtsW/RodA/SpoVE family cell cycle protein [Thermosipho ferrireducens]
MRHNMTIMLFTILILFSIGSIALYSLSFAREYYLSMNSNVFTKYITYIILGTFALLIFIYFTPKNLEKYYMLFYILSVVLLIFPLFFRPINGARRWIIFGESTFQSSELSKIFLLLFYATYIKKNSQKMSSFSHGLIIPLLLLIPHISLLIAEPDLSTSVLIFLTILSLLYFGGAKLLGILSILGSMGGLAIFSIKYGFLHSYQLSRLKNFLEGQISWQLQTALNAIKSGGIIGSGPALGTLYIKVPAAESDFILAIVGETLGYIGIFVLISSYIVLAFSLIRVSGEIKNDILRYFTWGYATLMLFHVVFNVGVVSGVFPVTGIPLPFVSSGGSALLSFLSGLGIIISGILNYQQEI